MSNKNPKNPVIDLYEISPKNEEKGTVVRYNINGEADSSRNNPWPHDQVAAQKITSGKVVVYRVAADCLGRLYDPRKEGEMGYGLAKQDKTRHSPQFSLKGCTQRKFDLFLRFLQTKDGDIYRVANREG